MSKHTPGPWSLYETAGGWTVDGPDRKPVCSPASARGLRPEDEHAANAYLIAAAPDLLAVLKAIHARRIAWPAEIEAMVVDAFAKAAGR